MASREDGWVAETRQKANRGDTEAQVYMGILHHTGNRVAKDDTQALAWYRKAADQGDAAAQYALGTMYENGRGVPQDYVEAVAWYCKAADQGYASAQFNLGVIYNNGQGVPQDYMEAHKWLNLAASRASAEDRDRYREVRDQVAARMGPKVAEAQRLAREWQAAFEKRQAD